jgi:polygalacturonase
MVEAIKTVTLCLITGIFLELIYPGRAVAQATLPSEFAVEKPQIPDRSLSISEFGAIGDGKTLNTDAISKAIAACEQANGGTVVVPAGRFLTGPFVLASNLNLHLADGATILMSDRRADLKRSGDGFENCISAADCHDIEITGNGTIDGQGQSWWKEFLQFRDGMTSAAPPHRPYMIMLTDCTRVMFQGVTLTNSPMFHLVPRACREVTIDSIHIKSPANSPNTDGIDPSGFDYLITNCTIDTGDDNIALKPRPIPDPLHLSCENFLIQGCTFLHGHGMSIGGGSNGGVRNMVVRDCRFEDTDAGIRLKSGRDRGGLVENLTYENLTMKRVKTSIMITSYYPEIPAHPELDAAHPITPKTPIWRHLRIDNVVSEDGLTAARFIGLAEMPIEDVVVSDTRISALDPMQIIRVKGLRFVNSRVTATSGGRTEVDDASVEGLDAATGR